MEFRQNNSCTEIIYSRVNALSYSQLMTLFFLQEETKEYFGPISRIIAIVYCIPFYFLYVKRFEPSIVLVKYNGKLAGGLTFSKYGMLGNGALSNTPLLKRKAIWGIMKWFKNLDLAKTNSPIRAVTANEAVIQSLLKRGFCQINKCSYILTLRLGWFTFSWGQGRCPTWSLPLVRITKLYEYQLTYRSFNSLAVK